MNRMNNFFSSIRTQSCLRRRNHWISMILQNRIFSSRADSFLKHEDLKVLLENGKIEMSTNMYDRERHSKGESYHKTPFTPFAVVYPSDTDSVAEVVKLCNSYEIPIVPYGAGTSIEGHVCCMKEDTISIDLTRLDKIVNPKENTDDFHISVGSGVHRVKLNDELRHTGMQFMVDPGADATIGTTEINVTVLFSYND